MRILYVNATLDAVWGGGAAERTRRLSAALARLGHRVTLLTTDLGLGTSQRWEVEGVDVVALRCLNKRYAVPEMPLARLRQMIRDQDLVHLTGHWTPLNALTYLLTRLERKPYAVNPAGALPRFGRSQILKAIYNALVGRAIIANADIPIAITFAELPQFLEYGVPADRISIIPNGVDAGSFDVIDARPFRVRHGLGDLPLILFMGRLNPIKGPDLLLDAFVKIADRFPSYLLVFAGPNEGMEAGLRDVARAHGLENRVRFVGHVAGDEKIAAYRAATFLAIPSRKEAMSIVVLEGGAAGIPALITDQCGFDAVEQVGGGRVVKAEVSAIADGLAAMLDDADKLPEAGRKLCNLVRRDYTWDAAAMHLLAAFANVLHKSGPSEG